MVKANFQISALSFASIEQYPSSDTIVGSATLQFYGPTDQDAFVHIPLIYPGSLNYGHHNISQSRHFNISVQYALFGTFCAMNIIQGHIAKLSNASRKMLCLVILDEVDHVLKTRDGLIFASSVRQATLAASSHCQYLRRRVSANPWSQ